MDPQTQEDGEFPPLHMRAPFAQGSILPPPQPMPQVANLQAAARAGPRALQGASLAGVAIAAGLVGLLAINLGVRLWRQSRAVSSR